MVRYSTAISKHIFLKQPFFSRLAAILVVAFTASAFAESPFDSASDTPQELEEVIVTAQKREQRLSDVPMSVSVVSGQVIEALGISNPYGQFGMSTQPRPRVVGIRMAWGFH